jgi:hypothetical protein
MWNYKIKNVSVKRDSNWKIFSYSIIVVSKTNENFTTAFAYTPEDAEKFLWIKNPDQAMGLVWQSCEVLKSLKLS